MSNYSNYESTKEIIQRISKKIPQGIMIGNTTVGHIEWQMYLMRDYLKLDGTPLANASNDYDELLKFAQDNSLITADTTDKSLFKYDSGTDVLTLPDYIGLCLQGGSTVEEKEAGLPNLSGTVSGAFIASMKAPGFNGETGVFVPHIGTTSNSGTSSTSSSYSDRITFDASNSNTIYGNSTTVQPPAITLIPQIKYKKSTVYEGIELGENYSTDEKVIGTWIDGKKLYQKTYQITTPSSDSWTSVCTVTGASDIISFEGFFTSTEGDRVFLNYYSHSSDFGVSYINNSNQVYMKVPTLQYYQNRPCYITLKYTKTTD